MHISSRRWVQGDNFSAFRVQAIEVSMDFGPNSEVMHSNPYIKHAHTLTEITGIHTSALTHNGFSISQQKQYIGKDKLGSEIHTAPRKIVSIVTFHISMAKFAEINAVFGLMIRHKETVALLYIYRKPIRAAQLSVHHIDLCVFIGVIFSILFRTYYLVWSQWTQNQSHEIDIKHFVPLKWIYKCVESLSRV